MILYFNHHGCFVDITDIRTNCWIRRADNTFTKSAVPVFPLLHWQWKMDEIPAVSLNTFRQSQCFMLFNVCEKIWSQTFSFWLSRKQRVQLNQVKASMLGFSSFLVNRMLIQREITLQGWTQAYQSLPVPGTNILRPIFISENSRSKPFIFLVKTFKWASALKIEHTVTVFLTVVELAFELVSVGPTVQANTMKVVLEKFSLKSLFESIYCYKNNIIKQFSELTQIVTFELSIMFMN